MSAVPPDNLSPPSLTTLLGTALTLPTPVVAASGTLGFGEEVAEMVDWSRVGAIITPTLTLHPRPGNPMPRTAETSAGLLHALGLPNPGIDAFLTTSLPRMRALPCPVIVSITGATPAEWRSLAEKLADAEGVAALELNLSPMELERAELPTEAALLKRIQVEVAAVRRVTTCPILAKLPSARPEIGAAAQAAVDAGADVIAVAQAFPGVAVQPSSRTFTFPGGGALSGPCIKPLALHHVGRAQTARRHGMRVPILGGGGIMTAEDALEFLLAGASAVTVGTASLIRPSAISRIVAGLTDYLVSNGLTSLSECLERV